MVLSLVKNHISRNHINAFNSYIHELSSVHCKGQFPASCKYNKALIIYRFIALQMTSTNIRGNFQKKNVQ